MTAAVRLARDGDWDAMCRVFSEAGHAAWGQILPAGTLAALSAPARWRPGPAVNALVAEGTGGGVVGFACVRRSADEDAGPTVGEVDALYTLPAVWGTGVGRALLSAAEEQMVSLGFTEATLWTEHRNHRPLRFYRDAGWELDGTERHRTIEATELLELRHRRLLP